MAPITPAWSKAIKKAQALGADRQVIRIKYGVYQVPSTSEPGVLHTVIGTAIDASDHRCSCIAGSHGRPCVHSAAVRLARVQAEAWRAYRRLQKRREESSCPDRKANEAA